MERKMITLDHATKLVLVKLSGLIPDGLPPVDDAIGSKDRPPREFLDALCADVIIRLGYPL